MPDCFSPGEIIRPTIFRLLHSVACRCFLFVSFNFFCAVFPPGNQFPSSCCVSGLQCSAVFLSACRGSLLCGSRSFWFTRSGLLYSTVRPDSGVRPASDAPPSLTPPPGRKGTRNHYQQAPLTTSCWSQAHAFPPLAVSSIISQTYPTTYLCSSVPSSISLFHPPVSRKMFNFSLVSFSGDLSDILLHKIVLRWWDFSLLRSAYFELF